MHAERHTTRPRTAAFTLVEILIVVVILGIVGAVVIPQFSNASSTARASMLADNLRVMRIQISVFAGQHRNVSPGYPDCDVTKAVTEQTFIAHITQSSNADGQTAAPYTPGFRYGPYFSSLAQNPLNGRATVQIILDGAELPAAGDDSHGYIYQASTLTFKSDSQGADEKGKLYYDY